jgi:hypothetical protein
MAAILREPLATDVEQLRKEVLNAGAANAKTLFASAESHLDSIGRFVEETSDLQRATFTTLQSVTLFARLLYEQSRIAEAEDARHQALVAIDGLAGILQSTNPSERAISLGY